MTSVGVVEGDVGVVEEVAELVLPSSIDGGRGAEGCANLDLAAEEAKVDAN